jgi:mono/diheme cytochrome c family protein
MNEAQARAILAFMKKNRGQTAAPRVNASVMMAADVFGRSCGMCHAIDGDGATSGPDLSHAGKKRDAAWLHEWLSDPAAVDQAASMPAFGSLLSDDEMNAIVGYLAARK